MKNAINVLVNEITNTSSEFEHDIDEILSKLDMEAAELFALMVYLNDSDSEMKNELQAELIKTINSLPTEQRFELDELIGAIAYARTNQNKTNQTDLLT